MNINELNSAIDAIDRIGDAAWISDLAPRKLKELKFHDEDRDRQSIANRVAQDTYEKFYGNKKYYSTVRRSSEYVEMWIRNNSKGRVFLDFACGNGANAIRAAEGGAALSLGFDISSVSVRNATENASKIGLENVRFFQADAENTKLPDCCIDTVICSGMLHHLDLSFAFPEIRRILKPGGRVLAVEALDYNPAIKLYRMFTPEMRTEWEKAHILSLRDLEFARRFFSIGEVRYWHVTGYVGGKIRFLGKPLDALDRLLEKIPVVQLLSWMFTFELIKRDE